MTETRDTFDIMARGSPETRANKAQPPQPPKLDIEEHRADLAAFNYTKQQEDEFIQSLWNVVCSAIDAGFGLDAVSMIIPAFTEKALGSEPQELDSKDTQTTNDGGEK